MTDSEQGTPEPGPDAGVDDIRADIEATRHELGQTVETLAAKLDVKQQAKQKVADTKEIVVDQADVLRAKGSELGSKVVDVATDDAGSIRPVVPVAILAVLAVMVVIAIRSRNR